MCLYTFLLFKIQALTAWTKVRKFLMTSKKTNVDVSPLLT